MKKSFSKLFFGFILAFVAQYSIAGPTSLIRVTGEVEFYCSTGGVFENDCWDLLYVERGSFTLVYDPRVRDSDKTLEDFGMLKGAIKFFTLDMIQ